MSCRGPVGLGAVTATMLLLAVGCSSDSTLRERAAAGKEVSVAMAVRSGRTYVCLADAIGDSKPSTCPAAPGSRDFPEVGGMVTEMLVSQLGADVRFDARVVLSRKGDAWELERYSIDGSPVPD